MKLTTFLILRRLSILAIPFLLCTTVLNAQIKIKERVEIAPNTAMSKTITSESGYSTSFTLEYPARVSPSKTSYESSYVDPITVQTVYGPCCPISCNGQSVVGYEAEIGSGTFGIFPAGTELRFSVFPTAGLCLKPECYITKSSTFVYPENCGGYLRILNKWKCPNEGDVFYTDPPGSNSYGCIVTISRVDACLPYHISFEFDDPLSLMYTGSGFVPIHLMDCCGYSSLPSPIWYRVEVTTGKEWCSLYDEGSGKRRTVVDSLYSPDGWSGFYLEATGEEPSEPQQCSLTVSSYGNIVPSQTFDFLVTPFERTLPTTSGRKEISYGDTTLISFALLDESGNPTGEELLDAWYSIIKGNGYGTLQSLDSTVIGEWIEGVFPSVILRTIDDGNAPDSLDILIETVATVPCPECDVILNKIASKDSSSEKGKDLAGIRKELLSQRLKRLPPTAQTNLQFAMQKKGNENQIQTRSSLITLDKVTPPSQTTRRSSPRLNKIQYDGPVKWYCGLTKVTVRKDCIHVQPATLSVGDTVLLSFVYGSSGNPVPMDKNLDVMVLGGTGGESGTLLVNGSTGTSFPGVKQPIRYIAPTEITVDELVVQIAAAESGNGGLSASVLGNNKTNQSAGSSLYNTNVISPRIVAALKAQGTPASCPIGSMTIKKIEKFCQKGGNRTRNWAGTKYDNYVKSTDALGNKTYYTVGEKGCALTCMAIIAQAGGAETDPGKLAEYMNDPSHYGFKGTSVNWKAINDLAGSSGYKYTSRKDPPGGKSLDTKTVTENGKEKTVADVDHATPINSSEMDQYLNKGALIAACVYNSITKNWHYVVVTQKEGNDYSIIDPACYSKEKVNLSDYGNIYKFIVYTKK